MKKNGKNEKNKDILSSTNNNVVMKNGIQSYHNNNSINSNDDQKKKNNNNNNYYYYNNPDGLITNVKYKIRVGDYALLNSNEKYFFNDININLKQNFINFNTVDDLSFNIYFNEWYYFSFFIVLEYQFNSFILNYNADILKKNNLLTPRYDEINELNKEREITMEYKKTDEKEYQVNNEYINENVGYDEKGGKYKTELKLNDFFIYKMPMKSMKN